MQGARPSTLQHPDPGEQHSQPREGLLQEALAGLWPPHRLHCSHLPRHSGYQCPPTRAWHGGHGPVHPACGVSGKQGGPTTPHQRHDSPTLAPLGECHLGTQQGRPREPVNPAPPSAATASLFAQLRPRCQNPGPYPGPPPAPSGLGTALGRLPAWAGAALPSRCPSSLPSTQEEHAGWMPCRLGHREPGSCLFPDLHALPLLQAHRTTLPAPMQRGGLAFLGSRMSQ